LKIEIAQEDKRPGIFQFLPLLPRRVNALQKFGRIDCPLFTNLSDNKEKEPDVVHTLRQSAPSRILEKELGSRKMWKNSITSECDKGTEENEPMTAVVCKYDANGTETTNEDQAAQAHEDNLAAPPSPVGPTKEGEGEDEPFMTPQEGDEETQTFTTPHSDKDAHLPGEISSVTPDHQHGEARKKAFSTCEPDPPSEKNGQEQEEVFVVQKAPCVADLPSDGLQNLLEGVSVVQGGLSRSPERAPLVVQRVSTEQDAVSVSRHDDDREEAKKEMRLVPSSLPHDNGWQTAAKGGENRNRTHRDCDEPPQGQFKPDVAASFDQVMARAQSSPTIRRRVAAKSVLKMAPNHKVRSAAKRGGNTSRCVNCKGLKRALCSICNPNKKTTPCVCRPCERHSANTLKKRILDRSFQVLSPTSPVEEQCERCNGKQGFATPEGITSTSLKKASGKSARVFSLHCKTCDGCLRDRCGKCVPCQKQSTCVFKLCSNYPYAAGTLTMAQKFANNAIRHSRLLLPQYKTIYGKKGWVTQRNQPPSFTRTQVVKEGDRVYCLWPNNKVCFFELLSFFRYPD
jgi:hypothetical protein